MGERQLHLFGIDDGERVLKQRNTVSLPLDTFVLLLVVVVLLFVLAFSLGVERGRKIASHKIEDAFSLETTSLAEENIAVKQESSQAKIIEDSKEVVLIERPLAAAETASNSISKPVVEQNSKQYIIQVATYLKEDIALAEAKKLKTQGQEVSVSKKGNFSVLFSGGFENREEAQKAMQLLRKRYKDCFIRRLK